jgi:hypothetical protein
MSHEYTLIVHTSPADGREDEYNAWYDDVHLAEFTALPGVINGRRFKVVSPDPAAKPVYAAIYETSVDPAEVLAAMNEGIKAGTVHMSDCVDFSSIAMSTLKPR